MDGAGRLAEKLRPQTDLKAAAIGAAVLLREYLGFGRAPAKNEGRGNLDSSVLPWAEHAPIGMLSGAGAGTEQPHGRTVPPAIVASLPIT